MPVVVVVADDSKEFQERLAAAGCAGETVAVEVDEQANELADVAIDVVRALGDAPPEIAAVVGVGQGGRAAHLIALAGRAAALVLVDGLPHRFAGPEEVIAARMEWMRQRVSGGSPPLPRIEGASFAERAAAGVSVPTLVVETSASQSPDDIVATVVGAFPKATLVRVTDHQEAAAEVASWLGA